MIENVNSKIQSCGNLHFRIVTLDGPEFFEIVFVQIECFAPQSKKLIYKIISFLMKNRCFGTKLTKPLLSGDPPACDSGAFRWVPVGSGGRTNSLVSKY